MLINSPDGSVARIERSHETVDGVNTPTVKFTLFKKTPQDTEGEGHLEVAYDEATRRRVSLVVRPLIGGEPDVADLGEVEIYDYAFDIEKVDGRDVGGVTAHVDSRSGEKSHYNSAQTRRDITRGIRVEAAVGQYPLSIMRVTPTTNPDEDNWQLYVSPLNGPVLFAAMAPERLSDAEMRYYRREAGKRSLTEVVPNASLPANMNIESH